MSNQFLHLPSVLLTHLSHLYLDEQESVAFSSVSHSIHRQIHSSYRVKRSINYWCLQLHTLMTVVVDVNPASYQIAQSEPSPPAPIVFSSNPVFSFAHHTIAVLRLNQPTLVTKRQSCIAQYPRHVKLHHVSLETSERIRLLEQFRGEFTHAASSTAASSSTILPAGDDDALDSDSIILNDLSFLSSSLESLKIYGHRHLKVLTQDNNTSAPLSATSYAHLRVLHTLKFYNVDTNYLKSVLSRMRSQNETEKFFPDSLRTLYFEPKVVAAADSKDSEDSEDDTATSFVFHPSLTNLCISTTLLPLRYHRNPSLVIWPSSLLILHIEGPMDRTVSLNDWHLPDSLTKLILSEQFNLPVADWRVPRDLRTLIFGNRFNHSLRDIIWYTNDASSPSYAPSSSLTTLQFGYPDYEHSIFNQSLSRVELPDSLTYLNLGSEFDQNIDLRQFKWPRDLQTLIFGFAWNQDLRELIFPPSLHTLEFGARFEQSLTTIQFPPSLTKMITYGGVNEPLAEFTFPPTMQYLYLPNAYDQPASDLHLPPELNTLEIGSHWYQDVTDLVLPSTLRTLEFQGSYDSPVETLRLPSNLTKLVLSDMFNQSVRGLVLPPTLTFLQFGWFQNSPNHHLNTIDLSEDEDDHRDYLIPSGLSSFNQPIDELIAPVSLRILKFGDAFQQSFDKFVFPKGMRELHVSRHYRASLAGIELPYYLRVFRYSGLFELHDGGVQPAQEAGAENVEGEGGAGGEEAEGEVLLL